jgi:hypothetical protein
MLCAGSITPSEDVTDSTAALPSPAAARMASSVCLRLRLSSSAASSRSISLRTEYQLWRALRM